MASPTPWTWVCVSSGSWWWTGRPGVLRFMGSQRVGQDWATEMNWTENKQGNLREGMLDFSLRRWSAATGNSTDWWGQIRSGVWHGSILSPCLFNLHAEYIIWHARLDELQAGTKITGSNSNNLRYADDITFMAESKENLKSLLMKVKKESEKVGLKLNT